MQAVIMFGSETWVLTPRWDKSLKKFHHLKDHRMAGMGPRHQRYRTWVYPPIGTALTMVGLE